MAKQVSLGGRPRHGEAVKNAPLSFRTSPELREALDEAARENRRSLTLEVEDRLRLSFSNQGSVGLADDVRRGIAEEASRRDIGLMEEVNDRLRHSLLIDAMVGSAPTARLLRAIGHAIETAEAEAGGHWWESEELFAAVYSAVVTVLFANRPIRQIKDSQRYWGITVLPDDVEQLRIEALASWREYVKAGDAWAAHEREHPELEAYMRAVANNVPEAERPFVDPQVRDQSVRLHVAIHDAKERADKLVERFSAASQQYRDVFNRVTELGDRAGKETLEKVRFSPPYDEPTTHAGPETWNADGINLYHQWLPPSDK